MDKRILICASAASSVSPMATGFAPKKPTTWKSQGASSPPSSSESVPSTKLPACRNLESHRLQPLQSGRGVAGAGFGIQLGGNRDAEANIFRRLSKHFAYDASRQAP